VKEQEELIIRSLKAGDEKTFQYLFSTYYKLLSLFALRYVTDLDIAKEIVQDLFVHLYEIRGELIISTSLKAYLYQSVRYRCLNHLKKAQSHAKHLENLAAPADTGTELEDRIMETELEEAVFLQIDQLPEQCKRIFLMSRVEGKKNKEIANILSISIRTVETQISKALKTLRENLKDYLPQ